MSEAPERIWTSTYNGARWEQGKWFNAQRKLDEYIEYIRADAHEAALKQARADALEEVETRVSDLIERYIREPEKMPRSLTKVVIQIRDEVRAAALSDLAKMDADHL